MAPNIDFRYDPIRFDNAQPADVPTATVDREGADNSTVEYHLINFDSYIVTMEPTEESDATFTRVCNREVSTYPDFLSCDHCLLVANRREEEEMSALVEKMISELRDMHLKSRKEFSDNNARLLEELKADSNDDFTAIEATIQRMEDKLDHAAMKNEGCEREETKEQIKDEIGDERCVCEQDEIETERKPDCADEEESDECSCLNKVRDEHTTYKCQAANLFESPRCQDSVGGGLLLRHNPRIRLPDCRLAYKQVHEKRYNTSPMIERKKMRKKQRYSWKKATRTKMKAKKSTEGFHWRHIRFKMIEQSGRREKRNLNRVILKKSTDGNDNGIMMHPNHAKHKDKCIESVWKYLENN